MPWTTTFCGEGETFRVTENGALGMCFVWALSAIVPLVLTVILGPLYYFKLARCHNRLAVACSGLSQHSILMDGGALLRWMIRAEANRAGSSHRSQPSAQPVGAAAAATGASGVTAPPLVRSLSDSEVERIGSPLAAADAAAASALVDRPVYDSESKQPARPLGTAAASAAPAASVLSAAALSNSKSGDSSSAWSSSDGSHSQRMDRSRGSRASRGSTSSLSPNSQPLPLAAHCADPDQIEPLIQQTRLGSTRPDLPPVELRCPDGSVAGDVDNDDDVDDLPGGDDAVTRDALRKFFSAGGDVTTASMLASDRAASSSSSACNSSSSSARGAGEAAEGAEAGWDGLSRLASAPSFVRPDSITRLTAAYSMAEPSGPPAHTGGAGSAGGARGGAAPRCLGCISGGAFFSHLAKGLPGFPGPTSPLGLVALLAIFVASVLPLVDLVDRIIDASNDVDARAAPPVFHVIFALSHFLTGLTFFFLARMRLAIALPATYPHNWHAYLIYLSILALSLVRLQSELDRKNLHKHQPHLSHRATLLSEASAIAVVVLLGVFAGAAVQSMRAGWRWLKHVTVLYLRLSLSSYDKDEDEEDEDEVETDDRDSVGGKEAPAAPAAPTQQQQQQPLKTAVQRVRILSSLNGNGSGGDAQASETAGSGPGAFPARSSSSSSSVSAASKATSSSASSLQSSTSWYVGRGRSRQSFELGDEYLPAYLDQVVYKHEFKRLMAYAMRLRRAAGRAARSRRASQPELVICPIARAAAQLSSTEREYAHASAAETAGEGCAHCQSKLVRSWVQMKKTVLYDARDGGYSYFEPDDEEELDDAVPIGIGASSSTATTSESTSTGGSGAGNRGFMGPELSASAARVPRERALWRRLIAAAGSSSSSTSSSTNSTRTTRFRAQAPQQKQGQAQSEVADTPKVWELRASCCSQLYFFWAQRMIRLGEFPEVLLS